MPAMLVTGAVLMFATDDNGHWGRLLCQIVVVATLGVGFVRERRRRAQR
ncbi:hypothetical protein GFY24_06015 [Nocardia sp. SYP-A9097]|nr:hypothetical protein [Nocardia sp. SYP-A9097]MRH87026.1 hypothetical protein [Nocardia sp. SYP-A9097]